MLACLLSCFCSCNAHKFKIKRKNSQRSAFYTEQGLFESPGLRYTWLLHCPSPMQKSYMHHADGWAVCAGKCDAAFRCPCKN